MSVGRFILVMLLATVKTLLTPPAAYAQDFTFWQAFLATASGGIIGFIVFFFLVDAFFAISKKKKLSKNNIRKARKIVELRRKYKLGVFLFLLPFLSIPVMAYIIRKFYAHHWGIIFASLGIVVFWSLFFSLVFLPVRKI